MLFQNIARRFDALSNVIDIVLKYYLMAAIASLFGLIVFQVSLRYFFKIPVFWVEELATYILASLVLFGTSAAVRHRLNVRVTTLYGILPAPLKHSIVIFVYCVVLFYCYVLFVFGLQFAQLGAVDLSPSGTFMMIYPRMVIPIAAVLIAIQTLNVILHEILIWSGHAKDGDWIF